MLLIVDGIVIVNVQVIVKRIAKECFIQGNKKVNISLETIYR